MALSEDDVMRIAHLARIEIEPREAAHVLDQLTRIFGLIERMQAVDTSGIEPMSHPQDLVTRTRADEVTESDQRALFQSIAPQTEAGLYLVPTVIE
jgi:aspartyl-tRNA(Asn)/glutamyl-tRNA(Gln) amidotransferase subunit C